MYHKQTLVMPLEDADPRLLGSAADRSNLSERDSVANGAAGRAPLATSRLVTSASPTSSRVPAVSTNTLPFVTEASAEFQRSLLQQQLQQSQREMERLKREVADANARLAETRQQLNEQKASCTSLSHRYSGAVDKLTAAEADMKKLEEHLVKERGQRHQLQAEREEQRLAARELQWELERVQRQLQQTEANRGLDPATVQRTLEDRTQYIPAVEVHRMQTELHDVHQSLVDRLRHSLESLVVSSEESQTNFFVARSAVLSAATDVEARLQRAEKSLEDVSRQWTTYRDSMEKETRDFLVAVMGENKDLWQQLTLLQSEHDVLVAEMRLKASQGGTVTAEEHTYVQRQLELMTERLGKAQQLVESQTILARAHEEEMAELLAVNDAMQQRMDELEAECEAQRRESASRSAALGEADAALREATAHIEELQRSRQEERQRAETMLTEAKTTQHTMQAEYDSRVRQLEHDCSVAEDTAATLQHTLTETSARLAEAERSLAARTRELDELQQRTQEREAETSLRVRAELQRVQEVSEAELAALREAVEEAQRAAREAARQRDDVLAREGAAAAAHHSLTQDVAQLREEAERLRRQLKESTELRLRAQAEADGLRASSGEGSTLAMEAKKRCELLEREKAELTAALGGEKARAEQRYTTLHADWKASEKARALLLEEVKTLRGRCTELENASMAQERQTQDKEQLMRENLRLHEQYQQIQRECTTLREEAKAMRQRGEGEAQWARQLDELQRKLRELPELRQAADAARRDALTAKEETEMLRREKDQLAQKLDAFLADARRQAAREDDFERVCREASAAAQRVGGMVSTAKESSTRYHVFKNTHPTGRGQSSSSGSGGAATAGGVSGSPRVSVGRAVEGSGLTATAVQHRSPVRVAGGGQSPRAVDPDGSAARSATSSPSRPWH